MREYMRAVYMAGLAVVLGAGVLYGGDKLTPDMVYIDVIPTAVSEISDEQLCYGDPKPISLPRTNVTSASSAAPTTATTIESVASAAPTTPTTVVLDPVKLESPTYQQLQDMTPEERLQYGVTSMDDVNPDNSQLGDILSSPSSEDSTLSADLMTDEDLDRKLSGY